MEPSHPISLSMFDWATILALAGLAWFLFVRDFKSRDELARTVRGLSEELGKIRTHMSEHYVAKLDHRREIDKVQDDLREHAKRFQSELEQHRRECPARQT